MRSHNLGGNGVNIHASGTRVGSRCAILLVFSRQTLEFSARRSYGFLQRAMLRPEENVARILALDKAVENWRRNADVAAEVRVVSAPAQAFKTFDGRSV